jgi:hypothetical protein
MAFSPPSLICTFLSWIYTFPAGCDDLIQRTQAIRCLGPLNQVIAACDRSGVIRPGLNNV